MTHTGTMRPVSPSPIKNLQPQNEISVILLGVKPAAHNLKSSQDILDNLKASEK
jgi:hypothetical protein